MKQRTTMARLEILVESLNRITKSPTETYQKGTVPLLKANKGNYHLDGAYGGWQLARIVNEGGGTDNVLGCGYVSKSELEKMICAYRDGIEDTYRAADAKEKGVEK
jgi:hypothetical protein